MQEARLHGIGCCPMSAKVSFANFLECMYQLIIWGYITFFQKQGNSYTWFTEVFDDGFEFWHHSSLLWVGVSWGYN